VVKGDIRGVRGEMKGVTSGKAKRMYSGNHPQQKTSKKVPGEGNRVEDK